MVDRTEVKLTLEVEPEKLDSFFLSVGCEDQYEQFAACVLTELGKLIPYDQAAGICLR